MAQSSAAASLAARPGLTLTRRLRARPEKVYAAWADPLNMVQWFALTQAKPGTLKAELDVRVGGCYRISWSDEKGEYFEVGGVYREVVPNERLKFTWAWHSTPERESVVTVQLKPDAAGTLLIFDHEQFVDEAARDSHKRGWSTFFDVLENFVAR